MRNASSWVAAVALAAGTVSAQAQTKWDMPTGYADAIFHTQNIRQFVDDVRKQTGGQVEIALHSNAALIKLPDIARAVQTGQVALGEILLSNLGNEDAIFEADSVPFLAVGFDNAGKLYRAHKPLLEKRFMVRGARPLFSVPWPGQGIYTRNPLRAVEDMKGVKFRAYSPSTARLAELMGAIPTTVQAADLAQAFATGVVSAMITSGATGVSAKAWEFSKYYYATNAFHPRNVVIVNERMFQRLPEGVRNAVLKAAADAEKRGWDMARQNDVASNRMLADNGMTVVSPDAALMAAFYKIGETMQNEWIKRAGPDGEQLIREFRRK